VADEVVVGAADQHRARAAERRLGSMVVDATVS
jgi:hypothetical protein